MELTNKEIRRASESDNHGLITVAARPQTDSTYRYFLVQVGTGRVLESDTSPQEACRWYQKCGGWSDMTKAARSRDKRDFS